MKNSYAATRKLWAMRTMSVANGNPIVAKALVAGITAANLAVGIWATKRLENKGHIKTAKAISYLNSLSLGVNMVDSYEIFKEIDVLSGAKEKKVVVPEPKKEPLYNGVIALVIEPDFTLSAGGTQKDRLEFLSKMGCGEPDCESCNKVKQLLADASKDEAVESELKS